MLLLALAAPDSGQAHAAMDTSLVAIWHQMGGTAKAVVLVLGIMGLYSLAVMIERLIKYTRARGQSLEFVDKLNRLMKDRKFGDAVTSAQELKASPLAKVVGAGLHEFVEAQEALKKVGPDDVGEFDMVDAVNRALDRTKEREVSDLRRGLGGLATIGASAPFVGLFGTVMGIIHSFQEIARNGSGGLGQVGTGIAEALYTTAAGLLIAIPSVMMFNYFTNRVEGFTVDVNDVSSELVDYILKEGRQ